jgi:arabinosaccharide transport system substrate-binding protein
MAHAPAKPSTDATQRPPSRLRGWLGVATIAAIGVASSLALALFPASTGAGVRFWTFSRLHHEIYVPAVDDWNRSQPMQVSMSLLGQQAIEQRMLSSFLAGTPSAELLEVERRIAARAFAGPIESVGFLDLTPLLERDGLMDDLVPASLIPWSRDGRVFGLPHDVHPVMLGYRADIVEAAGIDVSTIETWDDFTRVLAPLMLDEQGRKRSDRFLINLWHTHGDVLEVLCLQAGGGTVDANAIPCLDHPANAQVLASVVAWGRGPSRIASDAPYFSASGNKLLADGFVLASFVPDWMGNIWRKEIPQLSGKVKLMPLPAWNTGGLRTSVWGGTMLGIARSAGDPEAAWRFATHLYVSPELSRKLFVEGDIISPVRKFWTDPVYDQPDPFFSGQARGRLFTALADQVPPRYNSPFSALALIRLQAAASRLAAHADATGLSDVDSLRPHAQRLLDEAQRDVMSHVRRNRFYAEVIAESGAAPAEGGAR